MKKYILAVMATLMLGTSFSYSSATQEAIIAQKHTTAWQAAKAIIIGYISGSLCGVVDKGLNCNYGILATWPAFFTLRQALLDASIGTETQSELVKALARASDWLGYMSSRVIQSSIVNIQQSA